MNPREIHRDRTRLATVFAMTLTCVALLLGGTAVLADDDESSDDDGRGTTYEVTITNLTYRQIISPPVVVVHDRRFRLFEPGQPASDELAELAEGGATGPLAGLLMASRGVHDYAVAAGGIPPGGSSTVEVRVRGRAKLLSLAGMLITTNDAFAGLDAFTVPSGSSRTMIVDADAWDAGSERNTENCNDIPGPPCGDPNLRVTDGAEGFVHVHRGIHGVDELVAANMDWRDPVARVTIKRK